LCLGVVHGGLCGLPVGGALVDGLFSTEGFSRQFLSTVEFAVGEREPRTCCLQLGISLRQFDFVGPASIVKSRSAWWTMSPSLKWFPVSVPPT